MAHSPDQQLAGNALQEVVDLYRATDPAQTEIPLSGADVVAELGVWMERNHKLLRVLGVLLPDE